MTFRAAAPAVLVLLPQGARATSWPGSVFGEP